MKLRIFATTALAVVGLAIIDAQSASAQTTRYFTGATDTSWTTAGNWKTDCAGSGGGAVPGSTDQAVICAGKNANYDEATLTTIRALEIREGALVDFEDTARSLTITDAGGLFIRHGMETQNAPGKLDFDPASSATVILRGGGVHVIDGRILMRDADAILRFTSSNAILWGCGKIVGSNPDARLEIEGATVKLTSRITLEGGFKITETAASGSGGIFVNDGLVDANTPTTLLVEQVTVIDGKDGVYRISSSGTLQFSTTLASALFLRSCLELTGTGTVDIDVDFRTTGDLVYEDGTLDCSQSGVICRFCHAYILG